MRGRWKKVSRAAAPALYVSCDGIRDSMASPPSPRERAVLGLAWATRGLAGLVAFNVATALGLLAFVPMYNLPAPSLYQTGQLKDSLLLLSLCLILLGAGSGLVYCVGLAGLYGPREGLGKAHAVSVVKTKRWLAVTLVLVAAGIFVPSLTGPLLGFPGVGYAPPSWAWSSSVVLAGLRAIFAGLTLYYAVEGLAQEDARVRLLLGMALGVLGAIVWSGLTAYAEGIGTLSSDALLPFLAGAVAGLGTSAISLGLFIAVYREIRRELAVGSPDSS